MKRPEVLSPAGTWEALKAAACAGADAVYLGGRSFNARRNAGNFDDGEVPGAIAYCHARGIRAYVALNTVMFQNELSAALEFVGLLCSAGADAVILQDLGLLRLIRQAAPGLRLHASTQMSVHNLNGVLMLSRMGFRRVVLARELSREETAEIIAGSPIEVEVFVHGALCMSISGQCYLSAILGGRSGNRGLCAQPCRLPFCAPGGTGHDLSLKDLSLVQSIGELARMGVSSLKIEGRMKRPEYVAAATAVCAAAAQGSELPPPQLEELRSVFSRGGFTQGYYEGGLGRGMFGARDREDVQAAAGVLGGLRARYEGTEPPRVRVDLSFEARADAPSKLEARDADGNTAEITGAEPESAINRPLDAALVRDKLSKTGGTPFFAGEVACSLGSGLSLPVAELNRLRRGALDEIMQKRMAPRPIPFRLPGFSTVTAKNVENSRALRLRLRDMSQLTDKALSAGAELIFLPVGEISRNAARAGRLIAAGARLGAELPRAAFGAQWAAIEAEVEAAAAAGVKDLLCGNLGSAYFALERGFAVHGDFGLNVTNSQAVGELLEAGLSSCVLSFETALRSAAAAVRGKQGRCGLIAYGRLPLMLLRNCPLKNGAGCAQCAGSLRDRRGGSFPVACTAGASELFNDRPLWLCDKKEELYKTGVSFAALYFTLETPAQADGVLEAWQNGSAAEGEFTRGLYYRGAD